MFKNALLLLASLFVISSLAGETEKLRYAITQSEPTSIYDKLPSFKDAKAVGVRKGDTIVVVVKPKKEKKYSKVIINAEQHGWIADKDFKLLKKKSEFDFTEVEVKAVFKDNVIVVFGEEIPPTDIIEMNTSLLDKLQTNTDKEEVKRNSK